MLPFQIHQLVLQERFLLSTDLASCIPRPTQPQQQLLKLGLFDLNILIDRLGLDLVTATVFLESVSSEE